MSTNLSETDYNLLIRRISFYLANKNLTSNYIDIVFKLINTYPDIKNLNLYISDCRNKIIKDKQNNLIFFDEVMDGFNDHIIYNINNNNTNIDLYIKNIVLKFERDLTDLNNDWNRRFNYITENAIQNMKQITRICNNPTFGFQQDCIDNGIQNKFCNFCEKNKPLSHYHKDRTGKFGVKSKCKQCIKNNITNEMNI